MDWILCRECLRLAMGEDVPCLDCGSARVVRHAELDQLDIAHIDCDAFYASVEKRDRPALMDKPLIVGHPGGRGVVTTACYVARRFGLHSAMPMFKALQLCPHAVVIAPNMAKYQAVAKEIRAILASISDFVEPVSLDEAYIDLSEAHRTGDQLPAQALADVASRLERKIGITVSIGLAANKFLAKLASDLDKPRGFSVLGRKEAKAFLAALPVRKIHGVGEATAQRMNELGYARIGDLQRLSERELVAQFGKFGRRLVMFVIGEDDRKITPDRETKSLSAETTFEWNTGNVHDLIAMVKPLCERVASRLQRAELSGRTVVLKLKTAEFRTLTRNGRLAAPTQRADVLFERARRLIEQEVGAETFRLIGIGVSDLAPAVEADPPDLFSETSGCKPS
jgi:DNA polymerase IV